ncbi:MAG: succinate dehydrogenase assembly factor 2 [Deltaproteobacteria bacterium]|nr:MAG: succinate dehydrogenase assembly factor 2 [Deltaproteobacteria bacterium]
MRVNEVTRKVRFLCSRRSTLELETLLLDFFEREWEGLSREEREEFLRLLEMEDRDLEGMLFRGDPAPPGIRPEIVKRISRLK